MHLKRNLFKQNISVTIYNHKHFNKKKFKSSMSIVFRLKKNISEQHELNFINMK